MFEDLSSGELGEKIVAQWLKSRGYEIKHHRWRCRWGEIDLIAYDRSSNTLVFVEVKTRSSNNWDEGGLNAINSEKQEKIYRTAELFLSKHPHLAESFCRFDVALVKRIKNLSEEEFVIKDYLENAFEF